MRIIEKCTVVAIVVGLSGGGTAADPYRTVEGLLDSALAIPLGCHLGGVHDINRTDPEWVRIPPSAEPIVVTGVAMKTIVSHSDTPWNHQDHDLSVLVDPDQSSVLGTGNMFSGDGEIELEWEQNLVPKFVWPDVHDRVWVMGQYVFDCGHGWKENGVGSYLFHTEIHPPRALVTFRQLPGVFPGVNGTVDAVRADIWVSENGGGAEDGCNLMYQGSNGCIGSHSQHIDDRDIEFDIDAPRPRPGPNSKVTWTVQAEAGVPNNAVTVEPIITTTGLPERIHVRLPFKGSHATAFARSILVGWNVPSVTAVRHMRVTIDSVQIHDGLDQGPANPGEWKMWISVNEHWFKAALPDHEDGGDTIAIHQSFDLMLPNGKPIHVHAGGYEMDCVDDHLGDSTRPPWNAGTGACFFFGEGNDGKDADDDDIGEVSDYWRAGTATACANDYGVGAHTSRSAGGDTDGAFSLTYHIAELVAPTHPTLSVVNPVGFPAEVTSGSPIMVDGRRFTKRATAQFSISDGPSTISLGSALVTDCQGFVSTLALPSLPGGDYPLLATAGAEQAAAPIHVSPSLRVASAMVSGSGFGRSETVTIQHWRLLERASPAKRSLLTEAALHRGLVALVGTAAPATVAKPVPLPAGSAAVQWVAVATSSAQTDASGRFGDTALQDAVPRGFAVPADSAIDLLRTTFRTTGYFVATGNSSHLSASGGIEGGASMNGSAWRKFTRDPNQMLGSVAPVSISLDPRSVISEENGRQKAKAVGR